MRRISDSYQVTEKLPDGRKVYLRTIRPADRDTLHAEFLKLSKASVRDRFFSIKVDLTPEELSYFTEVDLALHVALVAEIDQGSARRAVGVGRFVRDQRNPERCEGAITVGEEFQGQGIGRVLLKHLIRCARELGVHRLEASVLPQNRRMTSLLRHTGLPLETSIQDGMLTYSLTL
jgi:RimJ/RimL family protein N-acetyltransferase